MKIAISADNGYVSAHFGRCSSYFIVEIEDGKLVRQEEIANPGHSPGYLPRFLAEKGIKVLITGGIGSRAVNYFTEYGIEVISGVQGTIKEVIENFLNGQLQPGEDLCEHGSENHDHHQKSEMSRSKVPEESISLAGKICFTSKGPTEDYEIEDVFGRAKYFLFVDPETMEIEAYQNPAGELAHGAGIQSAQLLIDKGVKILFTGQVGPNARQVLEAAGVRIIIARGQTIKDILNNLKKN